MRVLYLRCGDASPPAPAGVETHTLDDVPSRRALRFLDEATTQILPEDPTPSLDEIAARPDVAHLGTPGPAPQAPHLPERLRVIVAGTDAALSAVLTRLMRADHLWAEVGFVPSSSDSTAARNWGLPTSGEAALELAMTGTVRPVPLIRTDAGVAVAGSATITDWETPEITGEIIVDDDVLVRHEGAGGVVGARLVPMLDAPGIVAGRTVLPPAGWRERITTWPVLRRFSRGQAQTPKVDPDTLFTGRAVQAGGPALGVTVDGVRHPRALERVTFYRHLRDLQVVRP